MWSLSGRCTKWVCVRQIWLPGKAEELLRRALEIREAKLGGDHVDFAISLDEMSVCAPQVRRQVEAEELLRRALEIREAKIRVHVAWTLHEMGRSTRLAGLAGEADELSRRALEIKEAELGVDRRDVALTLREMGVSAQQAWRLGETKALSRRVLKIKEATFGGALNRCCRHAARNGSECAAGTGGGGSVV